MSPRHRTAALAAAVGLLAIVAILVLIQRIQRDGADSPLDVTTAPVTTGTVARRVMSTGTLQPVRTVDVGAQVSGTIHSIEADFNDRVRAGQIVARLDPSIYESQLGEAQARLEQAQAERERLRVALDDARAKLGRSETLATESLVPRAELDLAKTAALHAAADLKAADAAVASARASIKQAKVSLNHTIIRSPIDGIVISRNVDVGQTIASAVQTPVLFTIADLRRMQLLAEVAEADVGGVQPGSRVSFQIESIGQQAFDGTVSAVRLQPLVEQAAASTTGSATAAPAPAGTSGASSTPTAPAGQPAANATASSGSASPAASSSQPQSTQPPTSAGATAARSQSGAAPTGVGVVTYTAVIDVDNATGAMQPGGTAIITLEGSERRNAVRIPNNALTFRPPAEAFDEIDQAPPVLEPPQAPRRGSVTSTRKAYVWKFENRRFVPIAVEVGLADDTWTELLSGDVQAGEVVVTRVARVKN
jgi:HlyD family secretion protein